MIDRKGIEAAYGVIRSHIRLTPVDFGQGGRS
jgi:hypothetical protein